MLYAALRAKAEKGNAVAQYNLGLAYTAGEVVPKDAIEAYVWLRLATENGATGKALGLLMGDMSPSELAAGKLRLDEQRRAIAALASGDRDAPPANPTIVPPPPAPVAPAPVVSSPAKEAAGPAVDSSAALEKELAVLRDVATEPKKFREVVRELSWLLGYEALADIAVRPFEIETPLEPMVASQLADRIGLVPILRAGLGIVDPAIAPVVSNLIALNGIT